MNKAYRKINLIYIGAFVASIFIYLSFASFPFFESFERIIYEIEMRLDTPRNPGGSKVALVNIDDKSLDELGRWPWPRRLIAEMIAILKDNGAKLIGLDMVFSERDQNPGIQEIRKLYDEILNREKGRSSKEKDEWILSKVKEIEKRLDNDRALSETVKNSGNIILPVLGQFGKYDTELAVPPESFLASSSILTKTGFGMEDCLPVKQLTTPFDELSRSGRGLGHINISPNKVMMGQVHVPFIDFRGHIIPSLPVRLALDYLDKQPEQVIVKGNGIKLGEEVIPTHKGEILIKFKGGGRSFPYYSFVDILKVKKVPAVFDGKIVLIGFTAKGGASINTPVDPFMPRVEFMANVIEDLLTGRFLKRSSRMVYLESFILLLLGLTCSFVNSRLNYLNRTAATAGLIFLVFFISIIFFIALETWFKAVYTILCLITVYGIAMGRDVLSRRRAALSKDAIETNRMLGMSLQSQGLLDLAFEKFRRCPLDDEMRDIIYNLGLDYERKRMINKAISVYEYINVRDRGFRDLNERIPKLKKVLGSLPLGAYQGKKQDNIVVSDELEVKPTIGRYEILMELGKGAMGTVYKARDPRINRLLAIKTIRFSDEFEENQLEEIKDRFFTEAELAGKLMHQGIVAIFDVGEDYDLTYMAMEFLDGEDLQKFCTRGSLLSMRRLFDIIAETADALEYAHNNGVIHRDIKPANIMLLKNGRIKVTDFGIAKSLSSSKTKSGIVLGTPNYMSPEQIKGSQIDGRSDLFSLGVVFFQLLTGELPFKGENLSSLFYQITQVRHLSPREYNPHIIRPCEQIVDKLLAKNPDQRFHRARDLARYLRILGQKVDALKAQREL